MKSSHPNYFPVVADVGGTHIRFAALTDGDATLTHIEIYKCAKYSQIDEAIEKYLKLLRMETHSDACINFLCLAIPGAVHTLNVKLTNLKWSVNKFELESKFNCQVILINDFTAQALAIPTFSPNDLNWLRSSKVEYDKKTTVIVGPGTGLGVAALLSTGEVIESEAGHIGFSPTSLQQQVLLTELWKNFPRVSVERLLSGPGLSNIYRGLKLVAHEDSQLTPEEISEKARNGDQVCQKAITEFTRIFGSVCGDLALSFGAIGGVYLSGGIIKKLGPLFDKSEFLQHFDNKGRFAEYCKKIPIAIVLSSHPGLTGAANRIKHLVVATNQTQNEQA